MVGKLVRDPSIKNQNLTYPLINSLKCYTVCFYCVLKWRFTKTYLKLRSWPLALTYIKLFQKNKEMFGTSLPASFSASFLKKNISHVILTDVIGWLPSLLDILGSICFVIICLLFCNVINFEINLSFIIKPLYYMTKKSGGLSVARNCLRSKSGPLNFIYFILLKLYSFLYFPFLSRWFSFYIIEITSIWNCGHAKWFLCPWAGYVYWTLRYKIYRYF